MLRTRKRKRSSIPPAPVVPVVPNPSIVPDKLLLTPAEMCHALSITPLTLQHWTKAWLDGEKDFYNIHPVVFSRRKDGSPSTVRYRVDELGVFPGTFLQRYRKQIKAQNRAAKQAIASATKVMAAHAVVEDSSLVA